MSALPLTMKRYTLSARGLETALTGLKLETDAPTPKLTSEVVAIGSEVTDFKIGDKVTPMFPPGHYFEEDMALDQSDRGLCQGLGGAINGTATEYFVGEEKDCIKIPDYLTFEEACTFSSAPTASWTSLFGHEPMLQSGQTVLCLGTGGVSLAAAQFALISYCKVILTSSSATKLATCVDLLKPCLHPSAPANALQTIDYSKVEDWDVEARKLNGGRGVDVVVEVAGQGTLGRSIRSVRPGGLVAISGYLSDYGHIPQSVKEEDLAKLILYSSAKVRGTFICNKVQYLQMVAAVENAGIRPIIDSKVFEFEQLAEAYEYLQKGKHIGKVVIRV
ncbi:hypothetical protein MNV49_002182 [Pseudohyphozyma bogoriensis]|nr:hypothetical protein MNV49_002182 [Pseudohyphozyma bogoriensis]